MPDFPLIDAHVHLWDPARLRISWLDNSKVLNKRFTVPEFKEHAANVPIEAYVYVETGVAAPYALLEPAWASERAKEDPRLKGIVANAPVEFGEQLRAYLEALKAYPLVKGVRRIVQGEKEASFLTQPKFVTGVKMLGEFNYSFDICVNRTQLGAAAELAAQCPQTKFVLDHIGNPNIQEHTLDPWREDLKKLSARENVCCKLSGMVTNADREHWSPADLKPYADHVFACFGEDRVMFGGDWPVVLNASTYERWAKAADELTSNFNPAGRKKFWAENARSFYRM
jgi:L-fuconolactonase